MAEEAKQEAKKESANVLSVIFKVALGLVFLGSGCIAIYSWRSDLLVVIKGCIGLFLVLAGVITLAIAKE